MSSLAKSLFEKRLGSISMHFDILERIRFKEQIDMNMRYEDKWV